MSTGDFSITKTGTTTGGVNICNSNGTGPYVDPTTTITYRPPFTLTAPDIIEEPELAPPKCFKCGKEVESVCTFIQKNNLIIIVTCHNEERRIDVSLKRFKGDKFDAMEWFSDTIQWVFDEEPKWRKVKPDNTVTTIHADKKIMSDWLAKA